MTSYLIHVPPEERPGIAVSLDRTVLVKDGFHWVALFFPVLWLLYHRAWLVLACYLAVALALAVGADVAGLPPQAIVLSQFLLSGALAVFAPEIRSRTLVRRGWTLADVATGETEEDAARRFFARRLATSGASRTEAATAPRGGVGTSGNPVLGLFPQAGRP